MKRVFLFLGIVLLIALPIASAESDIFIGSDIESSGNTGYLRVYQRDAAPESSIFNLRTKGTSKGFNPYYARSTPATFKVNNRANSHIFLRTQLDQQVFQHPNIMTPRRIENNQRYLKAFNPNGDDLSGRRNYGFFGWESSQNKGFFNLFHAQRTTTGRLRTHVQSTFGGNDFSYFG